MTADLVTGRGAGIPAMSVGAQWGTRARARRPSLLGSNRLRPCERWRNNASHAIVVNGDKLASCTLASSSGILTPGCTPMIANGVVVDAGSLFLEELDGMERAASTPSGCRGHATRTGHQLAHRTIGQGDRALPRVTPDRHRRAGASARRTPTRCTATGSGCSLLDEKILRQKGGGRAGPQEPDPRQLLKHRASKCDKGRDCWVCRAVASHGGRHLLEYERRSTRARPCSRGRSATLLNINHGTYRSSRHCNATAGGACAGSAFRRPA